MNSQVRLGNQTREGRGSRPGLLASEMMLLAREDMSLYIEV
ncbi:MAG: hypothetical protein QF554_02690 [Dehalococcoidia bacterium]|nr:hypothetical protein [Dehalococcoidia bacterium]